MNTTNPFQVPSCLQRAQLQQRRQNRLKQIVVGSVAALTALLVFLLVEGCMSERAKTAGTAKEMAASDSETSPPQEVAGTTPKSVAIVLPKPVTPPAAVASAPLKTAAPAASRTETLYVVKSGDTLARIARQHRVTVKTIMTVNSLNDDRLIVGTKLKLPTV